MIQLKPFTLKLLYFAVGSLPIILMAFISQQDVKQNPTNLLWFGLFGALLIASIMVQKKIWETGIMKIAKLETYTALSLVTAIVILLIRQIL